MNVSVERLRIWLLVGGALLVLLIGAFLGYARYRWRHISVPKLPELGINVTNETDNVTFSHTAGKGGRPSTRFMRRSRFSIRMERPC